VVAEAQQVAGGVVGCLLVVDRHAGRARLVADGDGDDGNVGPQQLPGLRRDHRGDEDDTGGPVRAQGAEVAGDVGGLGAGAAKHHGVAAFLGFFLDALHDLGGQGVGHHWGEEPDHGGLPGFQAAGEVIRFVGKALDHGLNPFPRFVGVADEPVDNPGDGGRGDAGVPGGIADGHHCSSSEGVCGCCIDRLWTGSRKRFT
jgi:hypothetical protein